MLASGTEDHYGTRFINTFLSLSFYIDLQHFWCYATHLALTFLAQLFRL